MSVLLELRDVYKRVGTEYVLKGVSVRVRSGEFVVVRGRSGVGKTTLLRVMATLEEVDEGSVIVLGRETCSMSESEKARLRLAYVGFIHQFFNLIPSLTVLENIELPLVIQGVSRRERFKRVSCLLAYLGLSDKARKYPDELSGGERQRVAIARALVKNPVILLADEPLSNLDDETSGLVLELFEKYRKERNIAIVMATTDLYTPFNCDKEYLLIKGQLFESSKGS